MFKVISKVFKLLTGAQAQGYLDWQIQSHRFNLIYEADELRLPLQRMIMRSTRRKCVRSLEDKISYPYFGNLAHLNGLTKLSNDVFVQLFEHLTLVTKTLMLAKLLTKLSK